MEEITYTISLAQYPIIFHKSNENWQSELEKWFEDAKKSGSKLLVFPEYGSLDLISLLPHEDQLDLNSQLEGLQSLHDFFLQKFIDLSIKYSLYTIAPSFPIKVAGNFYNRAYFLSPIGKYDFQDKIHMTRFEESWGISPSKSTLKVFDTDLGKIGVQICFDIEFPWPSSLLAKNGVQLILNPSCTEGMSGLNRVHTGAKARALENQLLVAISQTVGNSEWSQAVDINNGIAAIYSPSDKFFPDDGILCLGKLNQIELISLEIDLHSLEKVRNSGDVFNYRKNQEYPWGSSRKDNLSISVINLK